MPTDFSSDPNASAANDPSIYTDPAGAPPSAQDNLLQQIKDATSPPAVPPTPAAAPQTNVLPLMNPTTNPAANPPAAPTINPDGSLNSALSPTSSKSSIDRGKVDATPAPAAPGAAPAGAPAGAPAAPTTGPTSPAAQSLLARLAPMGITSLDQLKAKTPAELSKLSIDTVTYETRQQSLQSNFYKNPDGSFDFSKAPDGSPTGLDATGKPVPPAAAPAPGAPAGTPPTGTPAAPAAPAKTQSKASYEAAFAKKHPNLSKASLDAAYKRYLTTVQPKK